MRTSKSNRKHAGRRQSCATSTISLIKLVVAASDKSASSLGRKLSAAIAVPQLKLEAARLHCAKEGTGISGKPSAALQSKGASPTPSRQSSWYSSASSFACSCAFFSPISPIFSLAALGATLGLVNLMPCLRSSVTILRALFFQLLALRCAAFCSSLRASSPKRRAKLPSVSLTARQAAGQVQPGCLHLPAGLRANSRRIGQKKASRQASASRQAVQVWQFSPSPSYLRALAACQFPRTAAKCFSFQLSSRPSARISERFPCTARREADPGGPFGLESAKPFPNNHV